MANWPASLPPPMARYSGKTNANVIRTDMDSGEARQRARFGDAPDMVNLNWKMTGAEFAIFRTFWRDELHRGSIYFVATIDIGFGEKLHQMRFVGGNFKSQRLAGSNFQVSAEMEVRAD